MRNGLANGPLPCGPMSNLGQANDEIEATNTRPLDGVISTVARWGVVVILVGVVVNLAMAASSIRGDATAIIDRVAPGWLVAAALLGLAPNLFHALRIKIWAGFLGPRLGLGQALRVAFGTELGSAVSPKVIGGAPVKVGMLMENGQRAGAAASISILNNLEDAVMFATVVPTFAFLTRRWEVPEVRAAIGGVLEKVAGVLPWLAGIALIILVWALWRRRSRGDAGAAGGGIGTTLAKVRDDFLAAYALIARRGKSRFVAAVALTTVQWACRWSVGTAVMYGIGAPVDPVLFLLLQWVVYVMMIFVPTPGAALGAEASFAAILGGFIPAGLLGLVTAGWRFFTFYQVLLVGLAALPLIGSPRPRGAQPAAS